MSKKDGEREDDLERREAEVAAREAEVAAREAALAERSEAAEAILDAADKRDATADARDVAADKRENDHDRTQLLATDNAHGYGGDWPERRNAALDRGHSKGDRTSSHDDRVALTEAGAEDGTDQT